MPDRTRSFTDIQSIMISTARTVRWLDDRRSHGALFIRIFAGTFLIYMSQDNVFNRERMLEFEGFLTQFGFPLVSLSARVSVYAQFTAGILLLLGLFTRLASAVMVANFLVALAMVHVRLPFREALDPAAMLASALFLFVHGAGPLSLDSRLSRPAGPHHAAVPEE